MPSRPTPDPMSSKSLPSPHQPMKPPDPDPSFPNPNPTRPPPSSSSACAACKYQRRKCNPDCLLAPYFPANRQREFLNAHRLYGISNMQKILRRIDPRLHGETMRSIIYESEARAADPVGGCHRQILDLQRQIQLARANLLLVNQSLDIFRPQDDAATSIFMFPQDHNLVTRSVDDIGDSAVFGLKSLQQNQQYYSNSNELNSFKPMQQEQQYYSNEFSSSVPSQQQQQYYSNNSNELNSFDNSSNRVLSCQKNQEKVEDDELRENCKGKAKAYIWKGSPPVCHYSSKTAKLNIQGS